MKSRKIIAILLTLALTFCFGFSALAATSPVATQAKATIVVGNVNSNTKLELYKALSITQMYDDTVKQYYDAYEFAPGVKDALIAEYGLDADASDYAVSAYLETITETADVIALAEFLYSLGLTAEDVTGVYAKDPAAGDDEDYGTYTYTGLALGYYLIYDATWYEGQIATGLLSLSTANAEINVDLKTGTSSAYTTPEKAAVSNNSGKVDGSYYNTQNTGGYHYAARINYSITLEVPDYTYFSDMSFSAIDTLGIGQRLYNNGDMSITVNGTALDPDLYTVTYDGDSSTGIVITFDFGNIDETFAGMIGAEMVISYYALVDDNTYLADGELVNDIMFYENGEEINGNSTLVYTYGLEILKTDQDGNPLEGAKFTIYTRYYLSGSTFQYRGYRGYRQTDDGIYYPTSSGYYTMSSANVDYYAKNGQSNTVPPAVGTMETDENGRVLIYGLEAGTYYIREYEAPEGYNKLTEDVPVVVAPISDTNDSTVSSITIVNYEGVELPSVGGIGTTLFIVFGCVIILGAGVLLFVNRKRVFGK